jgi:hypothetical protein
MPSLTSVINRFANQQMVYWQKTGSDSYGKPAYASPVQVPVRWEDRINESIMPDGRRVLYRNYILIATPLVVGSWVFLGTLQDLQNIPGYPNPPTNNQGGREIKEVNITPDIKAQSYVYEAYC